MNIVILFGGRSAEHEISCISAYTVYKALEKTEHRLFLVGITREGEFLLYHGEVEKLPNGNWMQCSLPHISILPPGRKPGLYIGFGADEILADAVFPALHGPYGEDGKLQGLLECANVAYAGAGLMASAVCMDKDRTREILDRYGILQVPWMPFYPEDREKLIEAESMGYPLFVKPANAGSSIGISKVWNHEELMRAADLAFEYDEKILVEKGLEAREIEVAALGDRGQAVFSRPGEICTQVEFYDYESKYFKEGTHLQIPAKINEDTEKRILNIAQKAYEAIGGEGLSRVDFFVEKATGDIYLNEINTMPGFTHASMYPLLMKEAGWSLTNLVEKLIDLALLRSERRNNLKLK